MAFFKFLTAATPAGLVSIHLHYVCLFFLPETGLLIRASKTDAVPYYDSNGFETQALAKSGAVGLVSGLLTKDCFNPCEGTGRNLDSARQSLELAAFSAYQAPVFPVFLVTKTSSHNSHNTLITSGYIEARARWARVL